MPYSYMYFSRKKGNEYFSKGMKMSMETKWKLMGTQGFKICFLQKLKLLFCRLRVSVNNSFTLKNRPEYTVCNNSSWFKFNEFHNYFHSCVSMRNQVSIICNCHWQNLYCCHRKRDKMMSRRATVETTHSQYTRIILFKSKLRYSDWFWYLNGLYRKKAMLCGAKCSSSLCGWKLRKAQVAEGCLNLKFLDCHNELWKETLKASKQLLVSKYS